MAEENENPTEGQFLPPDRIKAKFGLFLTKAHGNYQKILGQLRNAFVGEDNIEEVQNLMRSLNKFITDSDNFRKEMKEPFFKQGKSIDTNHTEFISPFLEIKEEIQKKLNVVAASKAAKIEEQRKALDRENSIKGAVNSFVIDFSVKIAAADSNEQLLSIERLINLEKANKSKYAEFLPLLIERCNELTDKIKSQKELVKQKEKLEQEKAKAEQSGDDEKLQELINKEQEIDNKIADNTVKVQEEAANSVLDNNMPDELDEVKARRTVWVAEIHDVKEAMKKAPELLTVELNKEATKAVLKTLKDSGTLTGKKEIVVNGIRYFEQKTF